MRNLRTIIKDFPEELVPVPEIVELGYGVETHPYMHKTKLIPDPTNDPDFALKAKEAKDRALEDSMFDEETEDGDWDRTLSVSEGGAPKKYSDWMKISQTIMDGR